MSGAGSPKDRTSEIGVQRQCSHCGEWWPLDIEFFTRNGGSGSFDNLCRDCRTTYRRERRAAAKDAADAR